MAIHYSNFGMFGENLKELADIRGFIPEEGDSPDSFLWPLNAEPLNWDEYLETCRKEIEKSEKALNKWRKENK